MEKNKLGETKFEVGKTLYYNEKAPYGKKRADKKAKVPSPKISAFK